MSVSEPGEVTAETVAEEFHHPPVLDGQECHTVEVAKEFTEGHRVRRDRPSGVARELELDRGSVTVVEFHDQIELLPTAEFRHRPLDPHLGWRHPYLFEDADGSKAQCVLREEMRATGIDVLADQVSGRRPH
jgi:hypothetical protein